jgi:hypothetical protein
MNEPDLLIWITDECSDNPRGIRLLSDKLMTFINSKDKKL